MAVFVAKSENELAEYISGSPSHRVWGYVRVSSKTQEEGQSLDAQQQLITEYCAKKRLGTPAFVVEIGSATKPLFAVDMSRVTKKKTKEIKTDPRPLFLQLLAHITQLQRSHLIVWKLDRFARHEEQELIMNLLRTEGTTLHSTLPSEEAIITGDSGDPMRTMMRQIMGAVAQYEAGTIKIRMEMGRRHKASKGGYCGGCPAFGYQSVNKELKVNTYEAEIIRIIYDLRYNHSYTQKAVAEYLNNHKSTDAPETYNQKKISRLLQPNYHKSYNGYYTDYYGKDHFREDLVIILEKDYPHG